MRQNTISSCVKNGKIRHDYHILTQCGGILDLIPDGELDVEELVSWPVDLTRMRCFKGSCGYISEIVRPFFWFEYCDPDEYSHLPEYNSESGKSLNNHYQYELFKTLAMIFRGNNISLTKIISTIFGYLFNFNNYYEMDPREGYLKSNLPWYAEDEMYVFNELWPELTIGNAFDDETCIEEYNLLRELNAFMDFPLEPVMPAISKAIVMFDNETCLEDRNLEKEFKAFLQPINKKIQYDDEFNRDRLGDYLLDLGDGLYYRNNTYRSKYSYPCMLSGISGAFI